jgi:hypothetical protein
MDRPGFETYSMMNMGMPMYPMPMNTMGSCQNNSVNQTQNNQIQYLENEINNLKARVSRLENSMYPEAVDYNKNYSPYQNSLNMM